jgi:hypothetical protein
MSDNFKKLTGKNPKDFEPVAYSLINNADVVLFKQLVEKDDFLFDFVKQNVVSRLEKQINNKNYMNLLKFLKFYAPTYEDLIISNLVKYSDNTLANTMLEIFKNGSDDEKTYCAKFFAQVKNSEALELLRENAYSHNYSLSANCAYALGALKDETSYNDALQKLSADDEFEKLDGVKFLVSYGDKKAAKDIINVMKKSSMAENMAGDLPYLKSLFDIYNENKQDALFVANLIINGIGEILSLSQVFDFELYNFLDMLINSAHNSQAAVVLLNAQDKFETLTENNEYLFDESKETKQEIMDIKNLLSNAPIGALYNLTDKELCHDSLFVFSALEFTENEDLVRNLLTGSNPTVILKSLETLKLLNSLTDEDKNIALKSVQNEDLKNVIMAI